MMSKGLLCRLGSVNDLEHDISSLDSTAAVNELQDVFSDDFPRVPPLERLNLVLTYNPILIQFQFLLT